MNFIQHFFHWAFNIDYKSSGLNIKKLKKSLNENTHCGKYWEVKSKFNIFSGVVSIGMEGNEFYFVVIESGEGQKIDDDFDGCGSDSSFTFKLGSDYKIKRVKS